MLEEHAVEMAGTISLDVPPPALRNTFTTCCSIQVEVAVGLAPRRSVSILAMMMDISAAAGQQVHCYKHHSLLSGRVVVSCWQSYRRTEGTQPEYDVAPYAGNAEIAHGWLWHCSTLVAYGKGRRVRYFVFPRLVSPPVCLYVAQLSLTRLPLLIRMAVSKAVNERFLVS